MRKRVQQAGTRMRGGKKREGARGLHRVRDLNPCASAFRQSILLPGASKGVVGVVRWVWRQFLVRKVSIFIDPYSIDFPYKFEFI